MSAHGAVLKGDFGDDSVTRAQELLRLMDRRSQLFGNSGDLFADPAWCLMLDLYVHEATATQVTVSSCGIASRVPMSTALRYIAVLVQRGLVERRPNPGDRRSALLRLTPRSHEILRKLLH